MLSKSDFQRRQAHLTHEHGAYILWLIKHRYCETYKDLLDHFTECEPNRFHLRDRLMFVVGSLRHAGLIEERQPQDESAPVTLHITEQWSHIQRALSVSLTQVASLIPGSSQVVTPVFGTVKKDNVTDIFVVMPFAEALRPIYNDHIKPTALQLGLTCRRGDDFFTNGAIIQDIWNAIGNAGCVIADCTGRNPNVFYELGMAHTVGVPTVLITRDKGDTPFDVSHIRRIEYEYTPPGMAAFEKALTFTLKELFGKELNDAPSQPT
jgi:hypothetical protein